MSSHIRDALWELSQDVDRLRIAPAATVRARATSSARRRVAGTAAVLAVGALVTPTFVSDGSDHSGTSAGGAAVTARVFLTDTCTPAQLDAIEVRLDTVDGVRGYDWESQDEAYHRFREVYRDAPDFVASIGPASLLASYVVTLADADAFAEVERAVGGLPCVGAVLRT